MRLPVPPRDEQDRIVRVIDAESSRLDAATRGATQEIALVREYRTRLIADAVTGKLDVREAAAQLPDEVEEAEPLDDASVLAEGDGSEGALDATLDEVVA